MKGKEEQSEKSEEEKDEKDEKNVEKEENEKENTTPHRSCCSFFPFSWWPFGNKNEDEKNAGSVNLKKEKNSESGEDDYADAEETKAEKKSNKKNKSAQFLPSSEEDDEEFDEKELLAKKEKAKLKKARQSVSAEAYGKFNKKGNFKAPVYPKSNAQKDRIIARLSNSFMFSSLGDNEMMTVIMAMQEKKFKKGQFVIKEGDEGDYLYVVDHGELECSKKFPGNKKETLLKVYKPGESFGELALLYNAPRAANIKTKTACILFALDRQTFNHIVKDAAIKKRQKYSSFLKKINLFSSLQDYELMTIADCLKVATFSKNEYVFKQNDVGDCFYIVEAGEAKVLKSIEKGQPPQEVFVCQPGDYFGELALLNNKPRAASVMASKELKCVYMDKKSFSILLGNIHDILKRNAKIYKEYEKNLEK